MKKRLMNNWGLKILAFFVAALLWFVVVNIDNPITDQTYSNIPVNVINAEVLASEDSPKTYQIVDNTQTVNVTVRAKRSVLSKISQEDIIAVADMKELVLGSQIPIQVSVKGHEYKEAYSNPRNLQIHLEDEETRKFPIVPKTTGTVRDGYVLGNIQAVPERVSIRGPKSVIDKISKVEAYVSVSGLSQDTVLPSELILYDQDGNKIDQQLLMNNLGTDGVGISVQLLNTKNIPIVFDTSEIIVEEGYGFAGITYEPREVKVCGETSALNEITEVRIPASVLRKKGIKEKTEQIVDISKYLPEGIQLVEENGESVVVTISVEKDGTKSFEVTVSSIVVDNLNKGMIMHYETAEALEISVRGPKEALETIDIGSSISIDMAKYEEPGVYDVPIKVSLPDHCILEKEVFVKVVLEEYE